VTVRRSTLNVCKMPKAALKIPSVSNDSIGPQMRYLFFLSLSWYNVTYLQIYREAISQSVVLCVYNVPLFYFFGVKTRDSDFVYGVSQVHRETISETVVSFFVSIASMHVCVCIYIYIYIYVCIHVSIYVYIHVCIYEYMNIYAVIQYLGGGEGGGGGGGRAIPARKRTQKPTMVTQS